MNPQSLNRINASFLPDMSLLEYAGVSPELLTIIKEDIDHREDPLLADREGLVGIEYIIPFTREVTSGFVKGLHVLAPAQWGLPVYNKPEKYTQAKYVDRFEGSFSDIARLLAQEYAKQDQYIKVFVCGGSAAAVINRQTGIGPGGFDGDFDLFLTFGKGLFDERKAWEKVDELTKSIRRIFAAPAGSRRTISIEEVLNKGCITFIIAYVNAGDCYTVKIQIILRVFDSISRVLHGFDIAACSVAYDGYSMLMTKLSAWTHAWNINLIIPEYASPSYVPRLAKYYGRGFALGFPCLRNGSFIKDQPLVLPCGLTLMPREVLGGRVSYGEISWVGSGDSDYDGAARINTHSHLKQRNIKLIASGKQPIVWAVYDIPRGPHGELRGLPFSSYAVDGTPCLSDILPLDEYTRVLEDYAQVAVNHNKNIDIDILNRLFGLDARQISMITSSVISALNKNNQCQIDISESLRPMINSLIARYDATVDKQNYWIIKNPSGQFSGSINPQPESLNMFLGEYYCCAPLPNEDRMQICFLLAQEANMRLNSKVFNEDCAICQEQIKGPMNIVTLKCGHSFHFASTQEGCLGIIGMIVAMRQEGGRPERRLEDTKCPICRNPFTIDPFRQQRPQSTQNTRIVINIDLLEGASF